MNYGRYVATPVRDSALPGLDLATLLPSTDAQYGEVFTRRWVVELILDLCEYQASQDLTKKHLIEPSVGSGAFLGVALDRLIDSKAKHAPELEWSQLADVILAMDLQPAHVRTSQALAVQLLVEKGGCGVDQAHWLAEQWIRHGDFLLADFGDRKADVIVGNPPYIRIEDISPALLSSYRKACRTMGGRADIYVGFYERGLDLLRPSGHLGYICADRWMRNQYGRDLRQKIITGSFSIDACLVMHDAPAFEEAVAAYPAVTILRRGPQGAVATGEAAETFDELSAERFAGWALAGSTEPIDTSALRAARLPHWHTTSESWPDGTPATLAWLEELSDGLPLLEDSGSGTRIGIGVATGADGVYVTKRAEVAEAERMLPLSMAADIKSGTFSWTGSYLVNPWDSNGLVSLEGWPRMAAYLKEQTEAIRRRSIAKRNPDRWYRTIDRVNMALTPRPKLLLEDMKLRPNPVLEPGGFYPHHNLYFLTSEEWDLEILGGLLLSEVVERQISAYCVKMRGKTLRFQAQYLRRVRLPRPSTLSSQVNEALAQAFRDRDRSTATAAALEAFSLKALPR